MAKNENSNFSYMTRRIGGTTYKVKVVFSDTEKETMEDKILRMIRQLKRLQLAELVYNRFTTMSDSLKGAHHERKTD